MGLGSSGPSEGGALNRFSAAAPRIAMTDPDNASVDFKPHGPDVNQLTPA